MKSLQSNLNHKAIGEHNKLKDKSGIEIMFRAVCQNISGFFSEYFKGVCQNIFSLQGVVPITMLVYERLCNLR